MFAAIREIYNIPRDENRKLRDYPTLAHVIRFVYENRPDLAGNISGTRTCPRSSRSPPFNRLRSRQRQLQLPRKDHMLRHRISPESIKGRSSRSWSEKTGYPQDMLDLDLDLEADLGVDTVKQAEMFAAMRELTTSRATRTRSCATIRLWRM